MTTDPQEPRQEAAFFSTIRGWGIVRGDNGVFGGVIEGVGNRIGMDRVPARLIAVVLGLFLFGPVILAYAAGWGLLPDRAGNIVIQDFGRGRPNVGALVMIGLLTLVGLGSLDNTGPWHTFGRGDWWPASLLGFLVFAGIVGLIVWLVVRSRGDGADRRYAVPPSSNAGTYATPPPGTPTRDAAVPPAAAANRASSTTPDSAADSAAHAAPAQAAAPTATASAAAPRGTEAPGPPPYVPRPRVPGPGRAIYMLGLAATLIAGAGVWWLEREGRLDVTPGAAFFAALVIIVGVCIIVAGAVGRRIGFLGFLGTVLIVGWVIALTIPGATNWFDDHLHLSIDGRDISGADLTTRDIEERAFSCASYDAGLANSVTADESAARWYVGLGQTITVDAGNAVVSVPEGARVEFRSTNEDAAATLSWATHGVTCSVSGLDDIVAVGGGSATIFVYVEGSSDIVVTEES